MNYCKLFLSSKLMILEACVTTLQEALNAQARGASRVEICSQLSLGGLTPDWQLVSEVVEILDIPVMVMIRPRAGDFSYTPQEFSEMKRDIDRCKELAVGGVVLGLLLPERRIDVRRTALLAAYAWPLEITFHKAIDACLDPVEAVKELCKISGVRRVLTSGGAQTAMDGTTTLKQMMDCSNGTLHIMPGGGVTAANLPELHEKLGASEYHGRAIVGELIV